mmetsp:Transcript_8310/g.23085  ORF Transcript_8310/g.23085 Transcript_8310/m.23085 type:complete len:82 (+) Transcript_8310:49-294(+)
MAVASAHGGKLLSPRRTDSFLRMRTHASQGTPGKKKKNREPTIRLQNFAHRHQSKQRDRRVESLTLCGRDFLLFSALFYFF